MRKWIRITRGLPALRRDREWTKPRQPPTARIVRISVMLAFGMVALQSVRLGLDRPVRISLAVAEPMATSFSRPDIVDRNGRLLATDVEAPSLFADAALVQDRDEAAERLATVLPDLDQAELRRVLSDRTRRFVWIRRGLSPAVAQRVHDLGIPGFAFRKELRRAYPAGSLAGHVLGGVNIDNRGIAGVERYLDETSAVDAVHGTSLSEKAPLRLSLDIGVQHAVEDELQSALRRYRAEGAATVILDIATGEVIASASLPAADPARSAEGSGAAAADRIFGGSYELGSVFKLVTVALAIESGLARPGTLLDVREPLTAGRFTIRDLHAAGRPLSVTEIFTHSSNVGAGMLALRAGPDATRDFMDRAGLLTPFKTEAGPVSAPIVPANWGRAETITVSYGHGLAVAPIQFAAAAAALLNGGTRLSPTFLKYRGVPQSGGTIVSSKTSADLRRLLRHNVVDADGTGKRADVAGYRVGGKTGTAERAVHGGYRSKAVISSFLGAFPMDRPRYLTFVLLFEPQGVDETNGQRTASVNAAPLTARIIERVASQLGVAPVAVAEAPR